MDFRTTMMGGGGAAYSSEVLDRGSSSSNKALRIGGYYDFGYTVVALLSNMVMNTIDFHYVVFFLPDQEVMFVHQVSENNWQPLCRGGRCTLKHSNIEGAENSSSAHSEKEGSGCEDQFEAECNQGS